MAATKKFPQHCKYRKTPKERGSSTFHIWRPDDRLGRLPSSSSSLLLLCIRRRKGCQTLCNVIMRVPRDTRRPSGAVLHAPLNWWAYEITGKSGWIHWIAAVFPLHIHIILPWRREIVMTASLNGSDLLQLSGLLWPDTAVAIKQRMLTCDGGCAACQGLWAAAIMFTGVSKLTRGSITVFFFYLHHICAHFLCICHPKWMHVWSWETFGARVLKWFREMITHKIYACCAQSSM